MNIVLYIGGIFYVIWIMFLMKGWHSSSKINRNPPGDLQKISVVIPVRNERENIEKLLGSMKNQTLDNTQFEVLIVDDFSDDNTGEKVQKFNAPYELRYFRMEGNESESSKKKALNKGIELAHNEVIVTTDGDCRPYARWLENIQREFSVKDIDLISGMVSFPEQSSLFKQFQLIEFASLIGAGGSTMNSGMATMCNGANLAFRKEVFEQLKGYDGNDHIASGDDEFFMHKVYQNNPKKVMFLQDTESMVETDSQESWGGFFRQRKRWASKWRHYRLFHVKAIAVLVALFNLLLLTGAIVAIIDSRIWGGVLFFVALKVVMDYLFLSAVLTQMRRKLMLHGFLFTQFFHIFYIIVFSLTAFGGRYHWKGRIIR